MNASNEKSTLMTEGSIPKKIILFAIPLFMGNLFQLLYNTADSLIVGNFLGSEALAAVSSSGSLVGLLVGLFNGISMGGGVVIARYYGARNDEKVQKAVHTSVAFALVCGVLLTLVGVSLAPQILILMGTPEDVLVNSVVYLRMYFWGSVGFVLYNTLMGILQSVGDSKHPLMYLIISSVINIVLDLLFIGVFRLGVGYAALATIISQFTSAILCLIRLCRVNTPYQISLNKIRFDKEMFHLIIANGLPAGAQNSIISFANVIVQSNINAFGKMAMAGCGAYSKVEGFAFLPITCFMLSMSTFISQNLGAKKYDRVKSGAKFGIFCSMFMAELIGIVIYIGAPFFISAFNDDPTVVAFGVSQARVISLFYCLLAFSHCVAGIMRGAGRALVPMIVMMVCWCIIRVSYITIFTRIIPSIKVIFWAYPLTWSLSTIVFLIYLLKVDWMHEKFE